MAATAATGMTAEESLPMPVVGIDRELIEGELRESPLTKRSYPQSRSTIRLGQLLLNWVDGQPSPRGTVVGGEARMRLRRHPDTIVGVDLAYISAEFAASTAPSAPFLDGPPILAVEIVSPSETHVAVVEMVENYLAAAVPVVWVVDPYFRTVMVHRPGIAPETFNETQGLSGDPHLPGSRVAVARMFGA